MRLRSIIADLLSGMAASLRGTDGTVETEPSFTADQMHPVGFWLCTHSTFDDFVVGCAYHAHPVSGSIRIVPYEGSVWAPFWDERKGRFFYESHRLDFVHLGPVLPDGHPVDPRTEAQRIEQRLARRAA